MAPSLIALGLAGFSLYPVAMAGDARKLPGMNW